MSWTHSAYVVPHLVSAPLASTVTDVQRTERGWWQSSDGRQASGGRDQGAGEPVWKGWVRPMGEENEDFGTCQAEQVGL